MTSSELDKIAFGFDRAIRERSISKIEIPYDLVLSSEVNCLESHGGMLYGGTDGGFYRFDPKMNRWKSYGLEDSLPSLKITALSKMGRKSIVIGTDKGVVYFNGIKVKQYSPQQNPPSGYITSISAVNDRNIWVTSEDDLFHYDGSEWCNYVDHEVTIGEDLDKIIKSFYRAMAEIGPEGLKYEIISLNNISED
jgi:ligand-binding sensor domain-containing protein